MRIGVTAFAEAFAHASGLNPDERSGSIMGMVAPEARGSRRVVFPLVLAALVALPAVTWLAQDHGVWPWDTAHMGTYTVDLWAGFNPFSAAWWKLLLTGMVGKAPGLPWVSHPFAGLGHAVTGDALLGLLVFQLVVQTGSALLLFRTGMHLTGGNALAGGAGALVFIAAPLSMGLSVRYYTEPLQTFAVIYFWWATLTIPPSEYARRGWHALLAATLGSITKVSTPLYLTVPLGWLVFDTIRAWRQPAERVSGPSRRRSLTFLAIVTTGAAGVALTWLALGYRPLLDFVRATSSGAIAAYYGEAMSVGAKLMFWLQAIERELVSRYVLLAVLGITLTHRFIRDGRNVTPVVAARSRAPFLGLAGGTLLLTLLVLAQQVNQDVRYLEPLLPVLALFVASVVGRWRRAVFAWAMIGVVAVHYFAVASHLTGLAPHLLPGRAQLQPPEPASGGRERLDRTIEQLRAFGGPGRTYFLAVDVVNFNTNVLELHVALQRLEGKPAIGFRHIFSPLFADYDRALHLMLTEDVFAIVTLPATAIPGHIGMENQLHGRVFDLLTRDARFVEVTPPELAPARVFKLSSNLASSPPAPLENASTVAATDLIVIDQIAGQAPVAGTAGREFHVARNTRASVYGWACTTPELAPPETVYLELTDTAGQSLYARMTRFERPDVAAHFQRPALVRSGIGLQLNTTELGPGRYGMRVLQIDGATAWASAAGANSLVVE